ncbi:glucoamylase I precursor [Lineolata rhizophorae]|uniref:glucan 1,4-alpha-glucosidase n=1 Tax=Lineolata rhizophorae TaxID=578093 RepID=A0A6A6P4Y1_9PEZI|nr:glucoamylase I precursor [Lineolata rhizophorae]
MLLVPFVLVAYGVLYALAYSIPPLPESWQRPLQEALSRDSLDSWLEREEDIAIDRLLDNVAPGGRNVRDAAPGTVIASPSRHHPNYYYQWVRDAAITTSTLVDLYAEDPYSFLSSDLVPILDAYTVLQYKLQHSNNPSGSFDDLSGLGEPKFEADGSPFTGSWGRPQRDGPALRALTLISYLKAYNETHSSLWDSDFGDEWFRPLYDADMPADSIIKADLEYVSHYWNASGFDLWEEVEGLHFFTAMVQARALREGAKLAALFEDPGAAAWYALQARKLEEELLPKFWSERNGHLVETLDSPRGGLDCGLLLGALHGTERNSTATERFAPYSDEVLVSLLALARDQRYRFPINSAPSDSSNAESEFSLLQGTGVGRYPEDVYDGYGTSPRGGNPWFLCTSSVAETLFRTVEHAVAVEQLPISSRGMPFWDALMENSSTSLEPGRTYKPTDPEFDEVMARLRRAGDAFLVVVKKHTDAEGRLSEQFDRWNGYERGAEDLTWSYGAFLQAVRARQRL